MALDPRLTAEQLWVIAQDADNLNEDLLEQIKYHDAAYMDLQEWATAALLAGVENVPPPPAPPSPPPAQRKLVRPLKWKPKASGQESRPSAGEDESNRKGVSGRVIVTAVFAVFVAGLLLIAGLRVFPYISENNGEALGATSEQSEVPLIDRGPDPQSGRAPAGAAARAGLGSFECATEGTGVACWGWVSDDEIRPMTTVPGLETVQIDKLTVGRGYAVAVDTQGQIYAWGRNDRGQLGKDAGDAQWEATTVGQLPSRASDLVAGEEHACALVDGQVWCFGSNRVGQIRGIGTDEVFGLTKIEGIEDATSLGSSGYSTWVLTPHGSAAWGNNKFGQVDPSDQAPTLAASPLRVSGD